MNLKKLLRLQIVFLTVFYSKAASTYENRQDNRKQKKLIEGSIDLETEPCEDFFQYACGNWQQVFAEAGTKYNEPITMMDYNVNHELSQAFKRFRKINKPKFINEGYNYYKSCTNIKTYKSANYMDWLILNDNFTFTATHTHFDWVQTLAKMRTYGFNEVFLQQTVVSRVNDVKTFIIDLDKPVEGGGFQPLTENNLEVLMDALPVQLTTELFKKLWQGIAEFEKILSDLDAVEDTEYDTELDYDQAHLIEVKSLPLEWLKDYLKIIVNQTELNSNMQLYIQNIPYMKVLDKVLKLYSQRFLCNYLEIRFLWYLHLNGPAGFENTDCLSSARSLMPIAMHWQYEQLHPELLEEYSSVYELFNVIRKHFNNTLISNKHGFNDSVISYLQTKLNHMKLRLNNVPRVDTVQILEKYYHRLNLSSKTFYENHLKLLRFSFLAQLDLLNTQTPILDFTYLENGNIGSSSLPYFLQDANTLIVPLTLLQEPIYSSGLDDIYKFSSLGFLLAREVFYGFDGNWLFSDADGSLKYIEFEGNPLFNGSLKCLLEINPNATNERITDISGLHYAYEAYFGAKKEISAETMYLHDHEISQQKLFFLNFAQFFCGNFSEPEQEWDHGRLTDALSHFPEFSREFNCKRNQTFYPNETCHLWN